MCCSQLTTSLIVSDIRCNVVRLIPDEYPIVYILDDGLSCSLCLSAIEKALNKSKIKHKVYLLISCDESIITRVEYINSMKNKYHFDGFYFDVILSENESKFTTKYFEYFHVTKTPSLIISNKTDIKFISYDSLFKNNLNSLNIDQYIE